LYSYVAAKLSVYVLAVFMYRDIFKSMVKIFVNRLKFGTHYEVQGGFYIPRKCESISGIRHGAYPLDDNAVTNPTLGHDLEWGLM